MIKLLANILVQIYNLFDFTIPGFPLSCSEIILGCMLIGAIGGFLNFSANHSQVLHARDSEKRFQVRMKERALNKK